MRAVIRLEDGERAVELAVTVADDPGALEVAASAVYDMWTATKRASAA